MRAFEGIESLTRNFPVKGERVGTYTAQDNARTEWHPNFECILAGDTRKYTTALEINKDYRSEKGKCQDTWHLEEIVTNYMRFLEQAWSKYERPRYSGKPDNMA
jgi:hypothetical protein